MSSVTKSQYSIAGIHGDIHIERLAYADGIRTHARFGVCICVIFLCIRTLFLRSPSAVPVVVCNVGLRSTDFLKQCLYGVSAQALILLTYSESTSEDSYFIWNIHNCYLSSSKESCMHDWYALLREV